MTDKKEKTYNKEEVDYIKHTPNWEYKCDKCKHKSRHKDICEILDDSDNEVNPNGVCTKFEQGKHLIIDQTAEEKLREAKNQFYNEQWRKKKLLKKVRT